MRSVRNISHISCLFLSSFALCACLFAGTGKAAHADDSIHVKGGEKVTLTIVYDNMESDDPKLRSDWGFGCVIQVGEKHILFDTGEQGTTLLSNMQHLGIDAGSIDAVVISHIHSDHAGGLKSFLAKRKGISVSIPASFPEEFQQMIEQAGAIPVEVKEPQQIVKGVFTTGEMGTAIKEQALVVRTPRGPLVVTGCAHPGIVEMVQKAADIERTAPYAVVGGFHTGMASKARLEEIIASFKKLGVKKVAPCHCSGRSTRKLFEKAFGKDSIDAKLGTVIEIQ